MTAPLQRVLRAFLEDPAASRYGYDLMKAASLKAEGRQFDPAPDHQHQHGNPCT